MPPSLRSSSSCSVVHVSHLNRYEGSEHTEQVKTDKRVDWKKTNTKSITLDRILSVSRGLAVSAVWGWRWFVGRGGAWKDSSKQLWSEPHYFPNEKVNSFPTLRKFPSLAFSETVLCRALTSSNAGKLSNLGKVTSSFLTANLPPLARLALWESSRQPLHCIPKTKLFESTLASTILSKFTCSLWQGWRHRDTAQQLKRIGRTCPW